MTAQTGAGLTPTQEARKKAAFKAAAVIRAEAMAEMCELLGEGGPEAVAEAAWRPGGPSKAEPANRVLRHFVPVAQAPERTS